VAQDGLARQTVLPRQTVLAGQEVLARHDMLARRHVVARRAAMLARPAVRAMGGMRTGGGVRSGARALADPDRAGSQQAPQLAGAGQIRPVARAQREILRLAGQVTTGMPGQAGLGMRLGARRVADRRRRHGEPVVGVRPGSGLPWVQPRPGDAVSQQGQLMTAALPDRSEVLAVSGQVERDLERLPGPVPARDSCHGQHRAIHAA
jgi:hypothetical protein